MKPEENNTGKKWDMWHKKRVFVRELSGKYAEMYQDLLDQPRVYKSKEIPFKGGPLFFHKRAVDPKTASITQTIESHIDVLAPGAYGQKHGHMNSALFYILDGKGYDVHEKVRYDWEAGDVCIVENGCVHQHFNDESEKPARYIVFKAKPLFLFFHLMFQKNVSYPSTEPKPGWENYQAED